MGYVCNVCLVVCLFIAGCGGTTDLSKEIPKLVRQMWQGNDGFKDGEEFGVYPGWATDNNNYFSEWNCTSPSGIDTIRRLNIAPLGQHPKQINKDSIFINNVDFAGGNPVLNFTIGDPKAKSVFVMAKAEFDGANWRASIVKTHLTNPGGVSSFDGTQSDYIMNEYFINGWGPTANKPGSKSKIPGVSEISSPNVESYPLVGTGPLGLTTIRDLVQGNPMNTNLDSCIHMNPTLYDYDSQGVPRKMAADLWASVDGKTRVPCKLPTGQVLPKPSFYIYHYEGPVLGWQLKPELGPLDPTQILDSATNYIFGSNGKFSRAAWTHGLKIVDLNAKPKLPFTALYCPNIPMSEATAVNERLIYFIADPPPFHGKAAGLDDGVWIHDIYVGFRSNPSPPPPGSNTLTAPYFYKVDGNALFYYAPGMVCGLNSYEGLKNCYSASGKGVLKSYDNIPEENGEFNKYVTYDGPCGCQGGPPQNTTPPYFYRIGYEPFFQFAPGYMCRLNSTPGMQSCYKKAGKGYIAPDVTLLPEQSLSWHKGLIDAGECGCQTPDTPYFYRMGLAGYFNFAPGLFCHLTSGKGLQNCHKAAGLGYIPPDVMQLQQQTDAFHKSLAHDGECGCQ